MGFWNYFDDPSKVHGASARGASTQRGLFTSIATWLAWAGLLGGALLLLGGGAEMLDGRGAGIAILGASTMTASTALGVLAEISKALSLGAAMDTSGNTLRSKSQPPTDPEERVKWANREPPYD